MPGNPKITPKQYLNNTKICQNRSSTTTPKGFHEFTPKQWEIQKADVANATDTVVGYLQQLRLEGIREQGLAGLFIVVFESSLRLDDAFPTFSQNKSKIRLRIVSQIF